MSHKIGVVDVDGGFRGIYAAGVFDYCLDNNLHLPPFPANQHDSDRVL